jgi:hypothetical protein
MLAPPLKTAACRKLQHRCPEDNKKPFSVLMRTVLQYFNPAMPFSDKPGMFIKMSSDENMIIHFVVFKFNANIDFYITI